MQAPGVSWILAISVPMAPMHSPWHAMWKRKLSKDFPVLSSCVGGKQSVQSHSIAFM